MAWNIYGTGALPPGFNAYQTFEVLGNGWTAPGPTVANNNSLPDSTLIESRGDGAPAKTTLGELRAFLTKTGNVTPGGGYQFPAPAPAGGSGGSSGLLLLGLLALLAFK